jgi:isoquinoline 1-oxidoreductase beta subunit
MGLSYAGHGGCSHSRRSFIKIAVTAAGGGLLLGIDLAGSAAVSDSQTGHAEFAPNAFLRIDTGGHITFVMPYIEMGQGTYTSIPMLIAEELEVEVGRVVVEHAPADDHVYVNPLLGIQMTGGSTSVRASWEPMRRAGATARVMLQNAAASQWRVDPESCEASDGYIRHRASDRRIPYGDLVAAAARLPVPQNVALKEPRMFKLIGTPHRRLDTSAKVDGTAIFGIDALLPQMKFAVLAISPTFGGRLVAVDEVKARTVPGVSQVVRLEDAVAVVGAHTWAAKQGLAAADPTWDAGENARLSTADVANQLVAASQRPGAVARREGDAARVLESAKQKMEAIYEQPFLAHAAMEPMNCTVEVQAKGCDVWVGTQVAGTARSAVARVTGLKPEQVRIHNHLLGGGFGRRLEIDGIARAAQIARQVDGPVKVIWTREEDIQHDMYRPYYYDHLVAALDEHGKPTAWIHRIVGSSINARFFPSTLKNGVDLDAVESSANPAYVLGAIQVEWVAEEPPGIPTAFWRGVGATRGTFVVESFIDELAAHARTDPLDYRLALLENSPRSKAVLELAAAKAGWGKQLPRHQGRGIALCTGFGTFMAQVVQVSVDKYGRIAPAHVVCVVDCGLTVNPDTVRAQMESGIIFGLSAALYGQITLKDGRVQQSNFHDYRVLRMNESPSIEVHLVESSEAPGGVGEPATSCVMPALANAVYAATRKRLRKLPLAGQVGSA